MQKSAEGVVGQAVGKAMKAGGDRVNAAVMKDPRMADMDPKTMPFDVLGRVRNSDCALSVRPASARKRRHGGTATRLGGNTLRALNAKPLRPAEK
jgi:hypothetical protein